MSRMPRLALTAVSALAFSISLAASLPALAQTAGAALSTHDQAVQSPQGKFIQDLGDKVIAVISNKQLATPQRDAQFSQMLSDSFDLKTIGRFVIGRSWNTATPDQQQEYMKLFKALVIKNYGDRMTLYTGEGFKVIGTRAESDMDTTVSSQITHPDGSEPTTIDWRVRSKDGKMGIIDVVVEGVSLSVTQRQEYAAVIQRSGGQIDGLLNEMRNEVGNNPAAAVTGAQ